MSLNSNQGQSPHQADDHALHIGNLTKRFGKVTAVDRLDLTVNWGEFFGFLGPNGAGKTTTIKLITGLLAADEGRILVGGHDIQKEAEDAKAILGYVPDKPYLYEKLTAREFLRFEAGLFGMQGAEVEERIESLLSLFELSDWGDDLLESFSHGMRQKVLMSGAFIHKPRLFVVDEPMVGLDPKGARLVKKVLTGLCEQGMTIFISTHSLEVAEQLCSRIAIIMEGRILAMGSKEELQQMAKTGNARLEEIFLQLTGGQDISHLLKHFTW